MTKTQLQPTESRMEYLRSSNLSGIPTPRPMSRPTITASAVTDLTYRPVKWARGRVRRVGDRKKTLGRSVRHGPDVV